MRAGLRARDADRSDHRCSSRRRRRRRTIHGGALVCTNYDGTNVYSTVNLPATGFGEWDFVMCSYTNGMLCDGVFRNGVGPGDTQCETQSITIYTAGQGASVGSFPQPGGTTTSPFIGAIDSVQVLAKFLSPAEVCNTAGLPGC